MASVLTVGDLAAFVDVEGQTAKVQAMVDDATALASRVAPCITTSTDAGVIAAARAVLRGAVLRWHESGSASYQQQVVGPTGLPTRVARRNLLWPSEVEQLQELCRDATTDSGAFSVDTIGRPTSPHADICAINFGATYCSCGAVLTNLLYPLYEVTDDAV